MAIVLETTVGDLTIDLYTDERPRSCSNFLKLCKMKYYNFNLFHTVQHEFLAQTGDPTGSGTGGESIWGVLEGPLKRYFEGEDQPKLRHSNVGTVSLVSSGKNMLGSQFFITLAPDLVSLDGKHCVIGEVSEGLDVLRKLNEAICDEEFRPYQDIRITHTVVLDDPFPDPERFIEPAKSPEPTAERLQNGRIGADEDIDETAGKSAVELAEMAAEREAKARATILEMVGDIPDAEMAPPENVLFVCKLNPVTTDDDLEIIFSRFGKVVSCEVIRDKQTGDSLQYAFVEFNDKKSCEDAYFKMDNVLIDDRRIHVDFSQSVAKVKWMGKGRGVKYFDNDRKRDHNLGSGNYKNENRPPKRENYERNDRNRLQQSNRGRSPENERYQPQSGNRIRSPQNERNRVQQNARSRSPQYDRYRTQKYDRNRPQHNRNRPQQNDRNRSQQNDRNRLYQNERIENRDDRNRYDKNKRDYEEKRVKKERSTSRERSERIENRDDRNRYDKNKRDYEEKRVRKERSTSRERRDRNRYKDKNRFRDMQHDRHKPIREKEEDQRDRRSEQERSQRHPQSVISQKDGHSHSSREKAHNSHEDNGQTKKTKYKSVDETLKEIEKIDELLAKKRRARKDSQHSDDTSLKKRNKKKSKSSSKEKFVKPKKSKKRDTSSSSSSSSSSSTETLSSSSSDDVQRKKKKKKKKCQQPDSSSEEEVRKQKKKKLNKNSSDGERLKKKTKKAKRKKSSSSDESSSESSPERYKAKKIKKK